MDLMPESNVALAWAHHDSFLRALMYTASEKVQASHGYLDPVGTKDRHKRRMYQDY